MDRFWTMKVDKPEVPDSLIMIVDEVNGGIIAYGCGPVHTEHILRLLKDEQLEG